MIRRTWDWEGAEAEDFALRLGIVFGGLQNSQLVYSLEALAHADTKTEDVLRCATRDKTSRRKLVC